MSDKITDEVFQVAPKKPNFKLVVVLSAATLLVLFVAAYVLLSADGRRLIPGARSGSHTTFYVSPAAPAGFNA